MSQTVVNTINFKNITLSRTAGTVAVVFRIYVNSTLTGTTYSAVGPYTNMIKSTAGVMTTPGVLVKSVILGPNESSVQLNDEILLRSNGYLNITADSASGCDVIVSTCFL